jgi:hypothetical protein
MIRKTLRLKLARARWIAREQPALTSHAQTLLMGVRAKLEGRQWRRIVRDREQPISYVPSM